MLIVLSSDSATIRFAKAPIASALHHHPDSTFVILTRDCSYSDIAALNLPTAPITHLPLSHSPIAAKLAPWVSAASMDRLMLPSLLPQEDLCLYLDIDTCVASPLTDLFSTPTGPRGIAARSSTRKQFLTTTAYATLTGITLPPSAGSHTNFNAGVLLLSLETLRQQSFTTTTLSLVQSSHCNDQIAIASYAQSIHTPLPPRFNHWPGHETLPDPAIIHFVGPHKPWSSPFSRLAPLYNKWL